MGEHTCCICGAVLTADGRCLSCMHERCAIEHAALTAEVEQLRAERERAETGRKHTRKWFSEHYGKLEDWARKVLPEPWSTQFFSCVANGLYDPVLDRGKTYRCVAGFDVTPGGYFILESAQEQVLYDQMRRAEDAESELDALRENGLKAVMERDELQVKYDALCAPVSMEELKNHELVGYTLHSSLVQQRVNALLAARVQAASAKEHNGN